MSHPDEILICKISRKFIHYNLLWPTPGTELNPGLEYKFKLLGVFTICLGLVVLATTHFCLVIINHEHLNTEELAHVLAGYGSLYMVLAFLKKRHQLSQLMKDLSNFKNFGKPPNFDKRNKQLDFFVILSIFYGVFATTIYQVFRIIDKPHCKNYHKITNTNGNYCGLLAAVWVPYDINYFPAFQVMGLFTFMSVYLLIKMPYVFACTLLEIVANLILRMEHLRMMISDCFQNYDPEVSGKKFKICVKYHIEILEFTARVDNIFFNIMFGHLFLTGGICACLEKQIVDNVNVAAGILHFLGWIYALYISCRAGQLLINATDIVSDAVWSSKWYVADVRLRKDLIFMLARSQETLYLRAGPFGVLSYALFIAILKTSYSILCVLRLVLDSLRIT